MKRLFLFVFIVLCVSIKAQNLVPNYSFENHIKCVNHFDEFEGYVSDWTGQEADGLLSYCTFRCNDTTPTLYSAGVPYNYVGFQYAHTGFAYTIISTFQNGSIDTTFPYGGTDASNVRNYIQAKLMDSLTSGITYYVTFYINMADSSLYSCSDVGAYLSDSALNLNGDSVKYYLTPQVANNPIKNPLTDTINWMKVSGHFIATGGEKYIIIGNFLNDSLSHIRYFRNRSINGNAAYYYIDDVIVSPDSAYADSIEAINELKVESVECKVYPNPNNGKFSVEITNYKLGITNSIEIYNMLGENVYNSHFSTTTTQIDLSGRAAGIYLYRIVTDKGEAVASGKLIVQ